MQYDEYLKMNKGVSISNLIFLLSSRPTYTFVYHSHLSCPESRRNICKNKRFVHKYWQILYREEYHFANDILREIIFLNIHVIIF